MSHRCDFACNHDPIKPAAQAPDAPVCQSCNGAGVIGTPGMKCRFCPLIAPLPAAPAPTEQAGELPPLQLQIFVGGAWKDAHSSTAAEFPPDQVRAASPKRPEMPAPQGTYADHSYPLYTHDQMVKAMLDSAALAARQVPVDDCAMCNNSGIVGSPPDNYFDCPDCVAARQAPAEAAKELPKWIDNLKGSDPTMDGLIQYIERMTQPVSNEVRAALELMVKRFGPCESDYLFSKRAALQKARTALAARQVEAPDAEMDALESALNPRRWTLAMSLAWHSNLPDTVKAFAELRAAAIAQEKAS